jgi:hypothetical protein
LRVNPGGVSQEPGCIAAFDLIPSGDLSSLIGNPQVSDYLERHHPEVMAGFKTIFPGASVAPTVTQRT